MIFRDPAQSGWPKFGLAMAILLLLGCDVTPDDQASLPNGSPSVTGAPDSSQDFPVDDEPAVRTAVLLVDLQEDFWSPQIRHSNPGVQESLIELLKTARKDELEVVHIRTRMSANPSLRPKSFQLVFPQGIPCTEGTPGAQPLSFAMEQGTERVFYKTVLDSFQSGELHAYLQSKHVGHVVIAGVTTDVCVLNTAFSAMNNGYAVTIIDECCASNDPVTHRFVLQSYNQFIFTRIQLQQFSSYRQKIEQKLRSMPSN